MTTKHASVAVARIERARRLLHELKLPLLAESDDLSFVVESLDVAEAALDGVLWKLAPDRYRSPFVRP